MSHSDFTVECDSIGYSVLRHGQVLGSFSNVEDAFSAKRDFSSKPNPQSWEKIPPAMRLAKQVLYGAI